MKEMAGKSQAEEDPAYNLALEHFHILEERLNDFIINITNLIRCIPDLCKAISDYSYTVSNYDKLYNSQLAEKISAFTNFAEKIKDLVKSEPMKSSLDSSLRTISVFQNKLKELELVPERRRRNQLLADSLREQYEKTLVKGNENKINSAKISYEQQKHKLNLITEDFIIGVDFLWERRSAMVEEPMKELVAILFSFMKKAMSHYSTYIA